MDYPLVSIITPCWNGESFLDRYFQSILAQTYQNLELIFVNDGSTDHTEQIALSYKDELEAHGIRFIYVFQENAGQAAALNRGLKLFTGDYLTWPDSDDVMTPDCIEKKIQYFQDNPHIEFVRSNGIYIDEDTGEKKRISNDNHEKEENIFEPLLFVQTYGCCGCYMMTRELLLRCYPDLNISESRVGQNWQLLLPAASRSMCGYIDADLYYVYERANSHSRSMREVSQAYERWDNFTKLLLSCLRSCECDIDYCKRIVLCNCARQKFYYAVSVKDKKMLRDTFEFMKKYGTVSWEERLLYYKKRYLFG